MNTTAGSDAETRAISTDHDALRLWLRLLATSNLIESRIRMRMQERFGMTLPRFDLMAQLARVPAGLRMTELSARMMVTGGNVTGIADALEREGMVARETDPEDRRASRVRLTPAGRRSFRAMAVEHESWIVETFSGLSERDVEQLNHLLGLLKLTLKNTNEERS